MKPEELPKINYVLQEGADLDRLLEEKGYPKQFWIVLRAALSLLTMHAKKKEVISNERYKSIVEMLGAELQ